MSIPKTSKQREPLTLGIPLGLLLLPKDGTSAASPESTLLSSSLSLLSPLLDLPLLRNPDK